MELSRHWRLQGIKYELRGEKCGGCGDKIFPPRDICPRKGCGAVVSPRGLHPERFTVEKFEEGWCRRNGNMRFDRFMGFKGSHESLRTRK